MKCSELFTTPPKPNNATPVAEKENELNAEQLKDCIDQVDACMCVTLVEPEDNAAWLMIKPLIEKSLAERATAPVSVMTDENASRPDLLERLTYHEYERDDMSIDDLLKTLSADGYKNVRQRTHRQLELQLLALLAAAPNPAVALEPWAPSEEQFEQWRARHGLHHSHNEAFYDAASLYLDATPPALAGSQVQAAGDAAQCTLGVGSGNGNLFVVGDYDSIKAAQAWILRAEKSESRLAEIQRGVDEIRGPYQPTTERDAGWRTCHEQIRSVVAHALLQPQGQADTSGLPG